MDIKELSDRLSTAMEDVDQNDRHAFICGWIKNLPSKDQVSATVIYGIFGNIAPTKSKHVLLLVHGIRTAAVWNDLVQEVFKNTEIRVIPIGYEYHDAIKFLWPFGRKKVVNHVNDQLRQVRADFPNASISLIAHSFGTYIVSQILSSTSGYRFSKIVFCGSIVDAKFRWGQIQELPERSKFINEVGFRDMWPLMAKSFSWGYGTSGSFGFKQVKINDRYHDLNHSGFFNSKWIAKFWLPFFCDDQLIPSEFKRENPPYWMHIFTLVQIKYVILSLLVFLLIYYDYWS